MTKDSGDSSKKEVSTTSTPQFQCPMLKPSNYSTWAIRMQVILEANGLWEMIEPNLTTEVNTKKDKTAIAYIYQSLPEEQLLLISKIQDCKGSLGCFEEKTRSAEIAESAETTGSAEIAESAETTGSAKTAGRANILDLELPPIPANPVPEPGKPMDEKKVSEFEKQRMIRKEDETICCGHIKNSLFDTLYDLYASVTNPRELWNALEFKYKTHEQGTNKYLVSKYLEFVMVEGKTIMEQAHSDPVYKDLHLGSSKEAKEPNLQIYVDTLHITNIFRALTATANVPSSDHLKMEMEMEIPSSNNVKLITECSDTTYTCYEVMKDLIKVSKLPQTLISYSSSQVHKKAIDYYMMRDYVWLRISRKLMITIKASQSELAQLLPKDHYNNVLDVT
ncbi:zinc finger, CCHC-type containing protein [Tanacetum coccineum]